MKISTKIGQLFQLLIIALSLVGGNAWALDDPVNGYYQIKTAQDLIDFASLVNKGNYSINAEIVADTIYLNRNVLNADGTLNTEKSSTFTQWTPMGTRNEIFGFDVTASKAYRGTFKGNGHYISGLYYNNTNNQWVGLFGYIYQATIDGVNMIDSYINGKNYVGAICGYNTEGTISNCSNAGTVSGKENVGGITGYSKNFYDSATITNVCNTGTVTGTKNVGGISGSSAGTTISGSFNTGSVSSKNQNNVGALCGSYDNNCSVDSCYYLSDNGAADAKATAKDSSAFANGEVAYLLQQKDSSWGQADDEALPSIGGGSSSSSSSSTTTTPETINKYTNCKDSIIYTTNNLELDSDGHLWSDWKEYAATCTDSSYQKRSCSYCGKAEVDSISPALGHSWDYNWVTTKSATCSEMGSHYCTCTKCDSQLVEDLAIVADAHSWGDWVTTKEASCSEAGVQTRTCKNDPSHMETAEIAMIDHIFGSNGFCTVCDAGYQPAEVENDVYQISNAGNLYWFATLVNGSADNAKAAAILTNDITVNADLTASGLRTWLPIGTEALPYKGTFDGDGYTISGLYYNGSDNNVGLFGYIQGATLKNVAMTGNSISGGDYVGSLCGYNAAGIIINCYNTSSVSGNSYIGGICGYCQWTDFDNGTFYAGGVYNCYNTGSVTGEDKDNLGGVCGAYSSNEAPNNFSCFYLPNGVSDDLAAFRTETQFASGELAIIMQMWVDNNELSFSDSPFSNLKNWSQVNGTDASPVLGGDRIEYTRANPTNNWGTLCLPYSFSYEGVAFYDVKGVVNNELVLSPAVSVTPGKPVVYYYTNTDNVLKVTIDSTAFGSPATLTANNKLLNGVYEYSTVTDATAYYLKDDKFYQSAGSIIANPFRAYVTVPAVASAPKALKSLALSVDNNASNDSEEATPAENENHIVAIYNISGQQVGTMDRGGIYLVKMSDGSTKKVRITE